MMGSGVWTNPLNLCLACLYFLLCSTALPMSKGYAHVRMGAIAAGGGDESRQNHGLAMAAAAAAAAAKEPTCDELRVMWRFSKRQSRAAEITNQLPTYRDPLAYNVWDAYARPRSAGGRSRRPMVFGRIVHDARTSAPPSFDSLLTSPERLRAFEEVARMYGGNGYGGRPTTTRKTSFRVGGGAAAPPPQQQMPVTSGQFQHLKELIRSERARELLEQRMKEEAVARAEALKDIVNQVHFGRIVQHQKGQLEQAVAAEQAGSAGTARKGATRLSSFTDLSSSMMPRPELYKRGLFDYYDDDEDNDDDVDSYGETWAW